jgi:beta-galactosidase GanA
MEISRRAFGRVTGLAALSLVLPGGAASPAPPPDGHRHRVSFDHRSLLVDGARVVLWSGEAHPFRLPSPSLWLDVLQKMRANGYNAVSVYVPWSFHSPAPGVHDFSGVRDLDRFLDLAAGCGLYVIARPGPYVNAEIDAGGFPGWLVAAAGRARTDDPAYLDRVDEWLGAVNPVIARHQVTRGTGSVLLCQLENEYDAHTRDATGRAYLAHLYARARADGIEVPLFHNDKGRNGYWVPGSFPTGGERGRYLYAFDGYPAPRSTPPDWGDFGPGGATGGASASPGTPGFLAEFGGGWFDPWGGAEFGGHGYRETRRQWDAAFERRFYLTNLANGIRLHNVYMTFGGTSWGWLPAPIVYTSYDYGAAFDEGRGQTGKVVPMRQIGAMLASFPVLAELGRAAGAAASDPAVRVYHLADPARRTHVYLLRNDSGGDVECTLPVSTRAGPVTVPTGPGGLRVAAGDMKLLATGLPLGHRTAVLSTAQPMLAVRGPDQDLAVLVGRPGDPVEVVLPARGPCAATVLDGSAHAALDAAAGTLRISAVLGGLTRVRVTGGGCPVPLLLLLADDTASATLWPRDTPGGTVLVRGPALLRTATARGSRLALTGDTTASCDLEVWAPGGPDAVAAVEWNGRPVETRATRSTSLLARRRLPGPPPVPLPALTGWRRAAENPESEPGYDDSGWRRCDLTRSHSTTPVPAGQPVLFADDYGFHYGDVWYRATRADPAPTGERTLALAYSLGTQGLLMAWWDGRPLGVLRLPVPTRAERRQGTWTGTAAFTVPAAPRPGRHTLAVLARPMAHDEDGASDDTHKAARGLTGATLDGVPGGFDWRVQGAAAPDPVRGPLNTGGLHGEREGWQLPGHEDRDWPPVTLPFGERRQGVSWFRTTFRPEVPAGVDASIGLTLEDDPARAYRAQIFLNGWNLGQYVNDVGPQHTFVLPNGVLRPRGTNTLALAVLADGTTPAGPGRVALTLLGRAAGGVPVGEV